MFKKLLVATDGSELGDKAIETAIAMAKSGGATITLLTATDPVTTGIGAGGFGTIEAGSIIAKLEETYAEQAKALLDAAKNKVESAGIAVETLHAPRTTAADAIIATAEAKGSDLIVMGSHGRRGLRRLLLGSQAAEVLSRSTIPVLIVK